MHRNNIFHPMLQAGHFSWRIKGHTQKQPNAP